MNVQPKRFVVCVANEGCDDLELRKLYPVVTDRGPQEDGYVRVIDESGEDYLYPEKYFAPVELPEDIAAALSAV
jgi:hypothetical protein